MRPTLSLVLGVCLLVAGSVGTVGAAGDHVSVESVSYGGEGVQVTHDRGLSVWQGDRHEFSVTVRASDAVADATVCLVVGEGTDRRQLACESVDLAAGEERTVRVAVDSWPANLTGERAVTATVPDESTGATAGTAGLTLTVLERDADRDGDGLTNEREVAVGTDVADPDTDGDMLSDAAEVRTYGTSPTNPDSDSDGLSDGAEVSDHNTDPTETDTDGDGLADGREVELGTEPTRADTDGDGLDDGPEVNRYQTDPLDVDTDGDGLSDAAEVRDYGTNPTASDTDEDGLGDGEEVTLYDTDPTVADTDGDGLDDAVEVQTYYTDPTVADTDGDGLADAAEVRDHGTDPLVADTDRDGVDDGTEVDLGSDPTDPGDTADPGLAYAASQTAADRPVAVGGVATLLAAALVGAVALRRDWDLAVGPVGRLLTDAAERRRAGADPADSPSADAEGGARSEGGADDTPRPESKAPAAGVESETGDADRSLADPSVLTNQERVERMLDERGGRMLQSDIVEAGDWSKATVSRVLSEMEANGDVTRVDIGKGNLVARPGDEPRNASSPFSE